MTIIVKFAMECIRITLLISNLWINILRVSFAYSCAPSLSSHSQSLHVRKRYLSKCQYGFFVVYKFLAFIIPPHLHFGNFYGSACSNIAATTLLLIIPEFCDDVHEEEIDDILNQSCKIITNICIIFPFQ